MTKYTRYNTLNIDDYSIKLLCMPLSNFLPVFDKLVTFLIERSAAYKTADELLGFLRNLLSFSP